MKVTSRDGVCVRACVGGCWVWGLSWVVTLGVQNLTHQDHTNGVKTGWFCQKNLDCFASVASVMKELTLLQP